MTSWGPGGSAVYRLAEPDIPSVMTDDGDRVTGSDFTRLREEVGLTPQLLATLAGVTLNTVYRLERGVEDVRQENYDAMYGVLDALKHDRPYVFAVGVMLPGHGRAGTFRGTPEDLVAALRKVKRLADKGRAD